MHPKKFFAEIILNRFVDICLRQCLEHKKLLIEVQGSIRCNIQHFLMTTYLNWLREFNRFIITETLSFESERIKTKNSAQIRLV